MDKELKYVESLRKAAARFRSRLVAQFEQARKDLRNEVLSRANRTLALEDQSILMSLVEMRLSRLAKDLREEAAKTIANAVDKEMARAVKLTREQNPEAANNLASYRELAMLRQTLVSDLADSLNAVLQDVKTKVRRELTQAALQERSQHSASRIIFGSTVREGVRPAFGSSYGRASAIAKSEYMKTINATVATAFKRMGGIELEWMSAGCACGCKICHGILSGQRRKPGQPFVWPGGQRLAPPVHPYCRCYLVVRFI